MAISEIIEELERHHGIKIPDKKIVMNIATSRILCEIHREAKHARQIYGKKMPIELRVENDLNNDRQYLALIIPTYATTTTKSTGKLP